MPLSRCQGSLAGNGLGIAVSAAIKKQKYMTTVQFIEWLHSELDAVFNHDTTPEQVMLKVIPMMFEVKKALQQCDVSGSVCDECTDGSGWYGDEDITYNCSKCNPKAN